MKINLLKRLNRNLLQSAIIEISKIRSKSEILAICPQATGYNWLGVNRATFSLFPDETYQIPQNYSNKIFTDFELDSLIKIICDCQYKQIILSGYPEYFNSIVTKLKKNNPNIKIKIIYHGHLSEFTQNKTIQNIFKSIIEKKQANLIDEIGFGKKGLALSVNKIFNLNTVFIPLISQPKKNIKPYDDNINIGVLVNDSLIKNYHNMIFAAYMKPNSFIHTALAQDLEYLPNQSRMIKHGLLPFDKYIDLLGSMTINLHTTFSEASGGLICSESIAQGVPCISSYTSSFFDYNDELKRKLIVEGFDDSWHIYQKIEKVLEEREYLSLQCIEYNKFMNDFAKKQLSNFLNL